MEMAARNADEEVKLDNDAIARTADRRAHQNLFTILCKTVW